MRLLRAILLTFMLANGLLFSAAILLINDPMAVLATFSTLPENASWLAVNLKVMSVALSGLGLVLAVFYIWKEDFSLATLGIGGAALYVGVQLIELVAFGGWDPYDWAMFAVFAVACGLWGALSYWYVEHGEAAASARRSSEGNGGETEPDPHPVRPVRRAPHARPHPARQAVAHAPQRVPVSARTPQPPQRVTRRQPMIPPQPGMRRVEVTPMTVGRGAATAPPPPGLAPPPRRPEAPRAGQAARGPVRTGPPKRPQKTVHRESRP